MQAELHNKIDKNKKTGEIAMESPYFNLTLVKNTLNIHLHGYMKV